MDNKYINKDNKNEEYENMDLSINIDMFIISKELKKLKETAEKTQKEINELTIKKNKLYMFITVLCLLVSFLIIIIGYLIIK